MGGRTCRRKRRVPRSGTRPLRRDAERNRQRILAAAAEVFNERGLDVSLDEIARHAGVGVGTVYRRFSTKEELVEALFMDRLDSVAAIADQALGAPDPWSGLVSFMERMAEMMAGDLGLRQILMFATYGRDLVAVARERNAPLVERLVERAQAAGQLRERPEADGHRVHRLRAGRGGAARAGGQS